MGHQAVRPRRKRVDSPFQLNSEVSTFSSFLPLHAQLRDGNSSAGFRAAFPLSERQEQKGCRMHVWPSERPGMAQQPLDLPADHQSSWQVTWIHVFQVDPVLPVSPPVCPRPSQHHPGTCYK